MVIKPGDECHYWSCGTWLDGWWQAWTTLDGKPAAIVIACEEKQPVGVELEDLMFE